MLYIKCLLLNTKKYTIKTYNLRIKDYIVYQDVENYFYTDSL